MQKREKKYPLRNCYTRIPVEITYALPDVAARRMRTFLSTTFAGTDGALEMSLSYMSLVAAGVRLPEVVLIFAGPGGEGETLILCDLIGSIWGTGHAVDPPSIFQTPDEFRRQWHLYRGMRWMSVGDGRRTLGIEEDVFKIFVSGGAPFFRKITNEKRIPLTGLTVVNPGR